MPGNPHPGTDTLLELDAAPLTAAGVRDGDLLAATEGGARTIAVRCSASCRVTEIAAGPVVAHGEGHVAMVADHPAAPGSPFAEAPDLGAAARAQALRPWLAAGALAAVALALVAVLPLRLRRR